LSAPLFQRRPMIRPPFHYLFCALIALTAIWGSSFVSRAEQPPATAAPPAEVKNAPPRAKPQVIYHLPRTSTYATTLHSQAKGQSNALPIDSTMPISLQMSRAAANEAAAQAESSPSPATANERGNFARQRTVKRSKIHSNRSHLRSEVSPKGRGPGHSHGNKPRKK
jgi:hypothetical protein